MVMKKILSLFLYLLAQPNALQAKDLGIHGLIYPIEEQDPIVLIQKKLQRMEETGELKNHIQKLQQKTKDFVKRPKPSPGITKAMKTRVFYYDPIYTAKEDLKNHLGQIIHKKGTRFNPLETVSLSQDLLFIDGDDPDQKRWAFDRIQKLERRDQKSETRDEKSAVDHQKDRKVKLILVKGAPLALSQELGIPVYFDQGGFLVKKLGIQHIPAIVSQSNFSDEVTKKPLSLRIEEICLSCSSIDKEEAHKGGENGPL